ncbi:hypothetical protein Ciccas_002623, partial [Cichlidogyrus casuarinus]
MTMTETLDLYNTLYIEFLNNVMKKRYNAALPLCKQILELEPGNQMALEFVSCLGQMIDLKRDSCLLTAVYSDNHNDFDTRSSRSSSSSDQSSTTSESSFEDSSSSSDSSASDGDDFDL